MVPSLGICKKRKKKEAVNMRKAAVTALVNQGLELERTGRFDEAHAKFLQAEQMAPNNAKTKKAFQSLAKAIDAKVDSLVHEAGEAYVKQDYAVASATLKQAESIGGPRDLVLYDLGVTAYGMKDFSGAADYLSQCLDVMPDGKYKEEVAVFHEQVITGSGEEVPNAERPQVQSLDELISQREPYAPAAIQEHNSNICKKLEGLQGLLPDSPALLSDLSKCAEMEGNQAQAQRDLEKYISLAPNSLNGKNVLIRLQSLAALDSVKGPLGEGLRTHYANAAQAMEVGRLDRAIAEYKAAEQLDPALPETQWRLGLLYESCGNVQQARRFLTNFVQLPASPADQRATADELLGSLDMRRALYDHTISEGRAEMADFEAHSAYLSVPLRLERLNDIARLAAPAAQLFPDAWEVNDLLANIYEQTGNQRLAFRSLDVLWASGRPVEFSAAVRIGAANGKNRVWKQSSYQSTINVMPQYFFVAGNGLQHIPQADVKRVETTPTGELRVDLNDGRIMVMDVEGMSLLTGSAPASHSHWIGLLGHANVALPLPLRRVQANRAARIFQRYLDISNVKFGSEHFTLTEKAAATGWLALNTYAIYASISNPSGIINSLNVIHYSLGGMNDTVNSAINFVRLVRFQQPVTETSPFRPVPVQPEGQIFRTSWK